MIPAEDPKPVVKGPHEGQHRWVTVERLRYVDTGQQYLESRETYEDYKVVWKTGQQAHINKNTKVDHRMFNQAAIFGWCTLFQGTNAASDISTSNMPVGQDVMGHDGTHQRDIHHGHLGAGLSAVVTESGSKQVKPIIKMNHLAVHMDKEKWLSNIVIIKNHQGMSQKMENHRGS